MIANYIRAEHPSIARLAIDALLTPLALQKRLTAEHHAAAKRFKIDVRARDVHEFAIELPDTRALYQFRNALSSSDGSRGAFTAPEVGFVAPWEKALTALPMRDLATITRIDSGNVYHEPTINDTLNEGGIVGENTSPTTQDVTFGRLTYTPYKFHSYPERVPAELPQDGTDFATQFGAVLAFRPARKMNSMFTNGTGAGQPMGVIPACIASGATVTAASASVIAYDDVMGLFDALGSGYFDFDRCRFMMNKTIYTTLRKLKDGQGRPLFNTNNGRLEGFRFVENHHMSSTMSTGVCSLLFGDFSKYHVVDFRDLRLHRDTESHAESDQESWWAVQRSSGNLADAGTHPVVALVH